LLRFLVVAGKNLEEDGSFTSPVACAPPQPKVAIVCQFLQDGVLIIRKSHPRPTKTRKRLSCDYVDYDGSAGNEDGPTDRCKHAFGSCAYEDDLYSRSTIDSGLFGPKKRKSRKLDVRYYKLVGSSYTFAVDVCCFFGSSPANPRGSFYVALVEGEVFASNFHYAAAETGRQPQPPTHNGSRQILRIWTSPSPSVSWCWCVVAALSTGSSTLADGRRLSSLMMTVRTCRSLYLFVSWRSVLNKTKRRRPTRTESSFPPGPYLRRDL